MTPPYWVGPCLPPGFGPPPRPDRRRPTLIILLVVLAFACVLLQDGYDLHTALLGAGGAGIFAGEVARRVVNPAWRRSGR
jgi:hypothetical protein